MSLTIRTGPNLFIIILISLCLVNFKPTYPHSHANKMSAFPAVPILAVIYFPLLQMCVVTYLSISESNVLVSPYFPCFFVPHIVRNGTFSLLLLRYQIRLQHLRTLMYLILPPDNKNQEPSIAPSPSILFYLQ